MCNTHYKYSNNIKQCVKTFTKLQHLTCFQCKTAFNFFNCPVFSNFFITLQHSHHIHF